MGHIRLGTLPATRKWQEVVGLISGDAPVDLIAGASASASEAALRYARDDPALQYSFWLLTQLPLAARAPDFPESLDRLGLHVGPDPSLLEIVGAFTEAIDRQTEHRGGRTDLGEIAQLAAADSLAVVIGSSLPSLFQPTPADVQLELGKLAARDRFAVLARDFFSRLTERYLDYYLSRELSNHTGPARRFDSSRAQADFNNALSHYCREASRIVEAFAGGWYSKTNFEGGITPEKAGAFIFIALRKLRHELRKRNTGDG
jgi:hypothetical protein